MGIYFKKGVQCMNISSSASYAGTSNLGYHSSASNDPIAKSASTDSLSSQDRDARPATISVNEKSPQEQQLEEAKQYKKEDQQKELKKKEADQFFEEQQKHKEEIDKIAYEMLANQGIAQIGIDNQLALNKDNYGDTVKSLVAKGFQIDTDEQKLTISSKLHQLKLEISKESYDQYVKTVYGKEIADEYTDTDQSSFPAPAHSGNTITGSATTTSPSSTTHQSAPSATPQSEPVSATHSSPATTPSTQTTQTESSANEPTSATTTNNSTSTSQPSPAATPTQTTPTTSSNNNSSTTGTTNQSSTNQSSSSTTSTSGSSGNNTSSSGNTASNNGNGIGSILTGGLVK